MARNTHPTKTCTVCDLAKPAREILPAAVVRDKIGSLIAARVPAWNPESQICVSCLNRFRTEFVREQMAKETGELSALEEEVIKSIHESELIVDNLNQQFDRNLTLGQRIADKVAEFGGSWRFIILFFVVMAIWILVNSLYMLWRPFDPFPFILFNLILSMLAAIQAPIIMMSQNRQEDRDRLRNENDYKVNLKAELEVRAVGEKLDQLLHNQWARLLEIQQIQMEMLEDLTGRKGK